jgi:hypothetical protein
MRLLTKYAFFEKYDQGQFCGVFAPGQPKNIPTRGSFPVFLPLVHLDDQVAIL